MVPGARNGFQEGMPAASPGLGACVAGTGLRRKPPCRGRQLPPAEDAQAMAHLFCAQHGSAISQSEWRQRRTEGLEKGKGMRSLCLVSTYFPAEHKPECP